MSLFEDVMSLAVQMSQSERERLAQALGVKSAPSKPSGPSLPMASLAARPDPTAWRKAETGHAVLDTRGPESGEVGAASIRGMWTAHRDELGAGSTPDGVENVARVSQLQRGAPVILHTDLCVDVACGEEKAARFFESPPVEIRLATASYLALLGAAQSEDEQARIRRFVQPFAVLSLGPMASSRAVELMGEHSLSSGLTPLDALIAATALAHEIPLVARDPRPFVEIDGLAVCLVE